MVRRKKAIVVLALNTLAFFVCFSCWVLYGPLVAFLKQNNLIGGDGSKIGWLIGIPILTGSIARLPIGSLTDRFGGRPVFTGLMFVSAGAMLLISFAQTTADFLFAGLGFGLVGASFAVGIAYTAAWFPPTRQGTALGIFGAGNLGAALTSFTAPSLLIWLTENGRRLEGWRDLPKIYAALLVVTAVLFYLCTDSKNVGRQSQKNLRERFQPLKNPRVWRFGLYYFCLFGGFVALSQWLIPYYVNAYGLSLKTAGILAALFSLPCALIRIFGGWISDHFGARRVLYGVFGLSLASSLLLTIPHIGLPVFASLVLVQGFSMGIGMGAVYKHIPSYFPGEVGVVGGLVGVIGGLGGFLLPILFGYLLKTTGLWSTCWIFFSVLTAACLVWMHRVVRQILAKEIVVREMEAEAAHA